MLMKPKKWSESHENFSMISGWQRHRNLDVPKNKHFFKIIQQNISYPYFNKTDPYKAITFKNRIQRTFILRKNQYIVKSIIDHFKVEPKKMIVKNAKSSCSHNKTALMLQKSKGRRACFRIWERVKDNPAIPLQGFYDFLILQALISMVENGSPKKGERW
jgi:hypothetical protein